MTANLIAYAMDWTAVFLQELTSRQMAELKKITCSVAKLNADINILISVDSDERDFANAVDASTKNFYSSEKFAQWKRSGVRNTIKAVVTIKDSVDSEADEGNGIILYSKCTAMVKDLVIIYWLPVKSQTKRVLLAKKLFGWKAGSKRYDGLIERYNGMKLGPNTIAVPAGCADIVLDAFDVLGISRKIMHVSETMHNESCEKMRRL